VIRILILLGGLGTGERLHMSQQEKWPLWIQLPEESSKKQAGSGFTDATRIPNNKNLSELI
jgi:hypothetical protein